MTVKLWPWFCETNEEGQEGRRGLCLCKDKQINSRWEQGSNNGGSCVGGVKYHSVSVMISSWRALCYWLDFLPDVSVLNLTTWTWNKLSTTNDERYFLQELFPLHNMGRWWRWRTKKGSHLSLAWVSFWVCLSVYHFIFIKVRVERLSCVLSPSIWFVILPSLPLFYWRWVMTTTTRATTQQPHQTRPWISFSTRYNSKQTKEDETHSHINSTITSI